MRAGTLQWATSFEAQGENKIMKDKIMKTGLVESWGTES